MKKTKESDKNLKLRRIQLEDCQVISDAFTRQGWAKPVSQYKKYFEYQESGERDILIAELDGELAGYLTIKWQADYKPFAKKGIPEIVDFNVLKKFQRLGIGTKLMDEAERRISKVSEYAGIGFGVTQDYGAAQILYIKRNYVPDGRGIIRNSNPLKHGEIVTIDDNIAFCLTKKLS